jgi:hypothetical protein
MQEMTSNPLQYLQDKKNWEKLIPLFVKKNTFKLGA